MSVKSTDNAEPAGASSSPSADIPRRQRRLRYQSVICIVAVTEKAGGRVEARADSGSFFVFRRYFLPPDEQNIFASLPCLLPESAVLAAAEASAALDAALSLTARAEQYRRGLERKLLAKKHARLAVSAALDHLESEGLISDERYAALWMSRRLRRGLEGPLSLSAALSRKSLDRNAIAAARKHILSADYCAERLEIIRRQASSLRGRAADIRGRLLQLGWPKRDIDSVLDET